jgi:hypothetical protein
MANIPYTAITFPISGQTYPMHSIINVKTSVTGFTEPVSRVDFYISNSQQISGVFTWDSATESKLGQDISSPYSLIHAFSKSGTYSLRAIANGVSGTNVTGNFVPITIAFDPNSTFPSNTTISGFSPSGNGAGFQKDLRKIILSNGLGASGLQSKWYIDSLQSKALIR